MIKKYSFLVKNKLKIYQGKVDNLSTMGGVIVTNKTLPFFTNSNFIRKEG